MTLRHIPLDAINQSHLQRLLDEAVAEARDIDYKKETYGKNDKDTGEFLADISSFANTAGGDIVIGMTEQAGIPTGFTPLQTDIEAEILRLEDIARSGLQPRIFGLTGRGVPLADGGQVLIVRIPRSYIQPHRIVREGRSGDQRFWARSSKGKYQPNVDELRLLFNRAPQLADRVRDFRFNRISKIIADDGPVPLGGKQLLTVHVAPLSAFDGAQAFQLDIGQQQQQYWTAFPLIGAQVRQFRINVDGCLILSDLRADKKTYRAYVQIFRSGIVESVDSMFLGPPDSLSRLTAIRTKSTIVKSSHAYLRSLQARDADPPYVVLVSLIGVKGQPYSFAMDGRTIYEDAAGSPGPRPVSFFRDDH